MWEVILVHSGAVAISVRSGMSKLQLLEAHVPKLFNALPIQWLQFQLVSEVGKADLSISLSHFLRIV